ncbi:MAG: DUF5615 family PIN-like protein [Akkermansiaceae bacterium]|nr:DUF5615 family PIN-like protein [Akkermansiaceae bacterium]
MKLLIDMNLSPLWTQALEAAGFAAVHWSRIGLADADDIALIDWARDNEAVVLTQDLDFSAILAQSGLRLPSVIQIRLNDVDPARIGDLVAKALTDHESSLAAGAILTLDGQGVRLRPLPLT